MKKTNHVIFFGFLFVILIVSLGCISPSNQNLNVGSSNENLNVGDTAIIKSQNEILSVKLLSKNLKLETGTFEGKPWSSYNLTVVVQIKNIGSTGIERGLETYDFKDYSGLSLGNAWYGNPLNRMYPQDEMIRTFYVSSISKDSKILNHPITFRYYGPFSGTSASWTFDGNPDST